MAIKSKEYDGYIEKTIDYRKTKLELWKLPERSETDYKRLAVLSPYQRDTYKEDFPNLHFDKEQALYFITRYDFQLVVEYIETIKDFDSKLQFLIEIKSDFERDVKGMWIIRVKLGHYEVEDYLNFGDLCQIEIDEIEKLQELEWRKKATEKDKQSDSGQLTTTQQVLAIRYFLEYICVKDIDKTVIARLIAVLRGGKNQKDIYDKVRDTTLHFINNGDDARLIANLFKKVQQPQIARMIENDLDELNQNKF